MSQPRSEYEFSFETDPPPALILNLLQRDRIPVDLIGNLYQQVPFLQQQPDLTERVSDRINQANALLLPLQKIVYLATRQNYGLTDDAETQTTLDDLVGAAILRVDNEDELLYVPNFIHSMILNTHLLCQKINIDNQAAFITAMAHLGVLFSSRLTKRLDNSPNKKIIAHQFLLMFAFCQDFLIGIRTGAAAFITNPDNFNTEVTDFLGPLIIIEDDETIKQASVQALFDGFVATAFRKTKGGQSYTIIGGPISD